MEAASWGSAFPGAPSLSSALIALMKPPQKNRVQIEVSVRKLLAPEG